jgi:hypothetical protein
MPQDELNSIINFLVPVILIIVAVVFVWWKFSEPLKKFGALIAGLFVSSKNKTFQAVHSTKEIVYDI